MGWAGGINHGGQLAACPFTGAGSPTDPTPWPLGPGQTPQELATVGTFQGPALLHLAALTHGIGLQGARNMKFTASVH